MICEFAHKLFPNRLACDLSEKWAEKKKQQLFECRYFSRVVERLKSEHICNRQKLQRRPDGRMYRISSAYYFFHLP